MSRNACIFILLIATLVALSGCSSNQPASETKKAAVVLDKIQGKVQVLVGASDSSLNNGGPSIYLWEGTHRYRLFSRTTADVTHGDEYVVEGINAQKVIDEIGDPAQGKNGYPLQSSCEQVVKRAWSGLAMDEAESKGAILRTRVARYPARTVFLVVKIRPATPDEKKKPAAEEKEAPVISVPEDKQRVALIEKGPNLMAPLWEPTAGPTKCKVIIGTNGKISELETGNQLCEAIDWEKYRYTPATQGGKPVQVRTEVEVTFDPRK